MPRLVRNELAGILEQSLDSTASAQSYTCIQANASLAHHSIITVSHLSYVCVYQGNNGQQRTRSLQSWRQWPTNNVTWFVVLPSKKLPQRNLYNILSSFTDRANNLTTEHNSSTVSVIINYIVVWHNAGTLWLERSQDQYVSGHKTRLPLRSASVYWACPTCIKVLVATESHSKSSSYLNLVCKKVVYLCVCGWLWPFIVYLKAQQAHPICLATSNWSWWLGIATAAARP